MVVVQDDEITHTNKESEHQLEDENEHEQLLNEDHTINEEEQVTHAKVEEEEIQLEVEPSTNDATKITEPISVVIPEDHHDAEVAAITTTPATPITTTTVVPVVPAVKPQMASLRSRFENLNNNNNNQLPASKSKELRSKSPNRISDMINRFS